MSTLRKIFSYIDSHKTDFVKNLKDAVAIQSVSAEPEHRDEIRDMVNWTADRLRSLGASVWVEELSGSFMDKPLPPVVLAELGKDKKKPTLLIYGHVDVVPANVADGWKTPPFEMTERGGKLLGRGTTDDKGPCLAWLHAVEAYLATDTKIPINLKFIFDGMEEVGSATLDKLLAKKKGTFMKGIDYVCISDSYWLNNHTPCLSYGTRGVCTFSIEVTCADKELHSGIHGGILYEAVPDLAAVLTSLMDVKKNIAIPGIMKDVRKMTDEDVEMFKKISYDPKDYRKYLGASRLKSDEKVSLMMRRWCYPSLSINGIQCFPLRVDIPNVIPKTVLSRFSIRIVPDQEPDKVKKLVMDHVKNLWPKLESPNQCSVKMLYGSKPWLTDPKSDNFQAAALAIYRVYGVSPNFIREGATIPITAELSEATGKSVVLLPLGSSDDGAHSQNEKIDLRNYIEGTKVMAAYFKRLSQIHDSRKADKGSFSDDSKKAK